MQLTIYKYPLVITDEQEIELHLMSWMHVGLDPNGCPCVWALVDLSRPIQPDTYTIFIHGTGHPLPDDTAGRDHLGSFVDGSFVWHVFARKS